jgi:hypothetical protein
MIPDRRITLITGQDMPSPDTESLLIVEAPASQGVDSEVAVWREERDWSAAQLLSCAPSGIMPIT